MAGSEFAGLPGTIGLTGASGMVGRAVLDLAGDNAIAVSATSRRAPQAAAGNVRWQAHDLCDWTDDRALDRLYPDCRALIHAGAVIPGHGAPVDDRAVIDGNVRACWNLGKWALARAIRVVYVSGSNVYAEPEGAHLAETAPLGPSAISGIYGLSKLMAENVFAELARQGLAVTVLRPASVYGPGLPRGKMIWRFLEMAAAGETIRLERPVDDRHNLVHARDLARACLLALAAGPGGVFNVAAPAAATVEEIARICVETVSRGSVEIDAAPSKRPAVTRFELDGSAAARELGYRPQVSVRDGILDLWRREGAG